jgi:hypothetical protein
VPYQLAFTVRAPVLPGRASELQQALRAIGVESERRRLLPFEQLAVHFARMFVLDDVDDLDGSDIPASLVFLIDVDAPLSPFLDELCRVAGEGLDRVFSLCVGYPSQTSPEARLSYLQKHSVHAGAVYVNTVGRSVQQVHQEAELRERIEDFLDARAGSFDGEAPGAIRTAVEDFVRNDQGLSWALNPAAKPALSWRVGQVARFAGAIIVAVLLLPFAIVALPVFVVLLRIHETRDPTVRVQATAEKLAELQAVEDHVTQNQFTVVGFRKPGPFRSFVLTVVLAVLDLGCRHIFNNGSLAGIRTIHFARWIVIDGRRRVLFASNYDGSLESYMDDFIDKVAYGLNAVFSNGVGYPRTNWLILDGAHDEQAFKEVLRAYQIVTPVWYSAYPDLTAVNVANNAAIRAGLTRPLSEDQARSWIARL